MGKELDNQEEIAAKLEEMHQDIQNLTDIVELIKERIENESLQRSSYNEDWDTERTIQ